MKQTSRRNRRSHYLAALPLLGAALASSGAQAQDTASQGERRPGSLGVRASVAPEGIGNNPQGASTTANGIPLDINRSLVVTDPAVLSGFPLRETMEAIFASAKVPAAGSTLTNSSRVVWQQLWRHFSADPLAANDIQTRCPDATPAGLAPGGSPDGTTPNRCPRPSDAAARSEDPFETNTLTPDAQFVPTALFNRVDLIDGAGAHCGEYRVIYARRSGVQFGQRAHIIFEAVLPNPNPSLGLAGCRPIQAFWRDLSTVSNPVEQRRRLRKFYYEGLPGSRPVFNVFNYADASSGGSGGRVRTNTFRDSPWMLNEFKYECGTGARCEIVPKGVTDKDNYHISFFAPTSVAPAVGSDLDNFQREIVANVASLAINDVNRFHLSTNTDRFNDKFSDTGNGSFGSTEYLARFGTGGTFRQRIQAELTRIQSPLTPENILTRVETQTCSGCHISANGDALGGGLAGFPSAAGFVHVNESPDATGRAQLSSALTTEFLPHRAKTLATFLNSSAALNVQKLVAGVTPAIDGNLNEPSWTLTNNVSKLVNPPGLVSASDNDVAWGATWNDQFLFLGARVTDANLFNDSGAQSNMHNDDVVEFFIDGNNQRSTTFDGDDRQYVKRFNDTSVFEKLGRVTGVQHAWARINGGYSVELAIPWGTLGVTPALNKLLGFDVGVNDDDNGGNREGQLVGTGTENNFQNTSAYGTIRLVAATAATTLVASSSSVLPVVDGNPSERMYNLSGEAHERTHGPAELFPSRVRYGAVKTPTHLVLGAIVKDATPFNDSVNTFDDDSVEFLLDIAGNKSNPYDTNDFQLIKGRGDSTITIARRGVAVSLAGVSHATTAVPGGYAVEITIPWSSFGLSAAPAQIGFDAAINDDFNGAAREAQAITFGDANSWDSAALFGTLKL